MLPKPTLATAIPPPAINSNTGGLLSTSTHPITGHHPVVTSTILPPSLGQTVIGGISVATTALANQVTVTGSSGGGGMGASAMMPPVAHHPGGLAPFNPPPTQLPSFM